MSNLAKAWPMPELHPVTTAVGMVQKSGRCVYAKLLVSSRAKQLVSSKAKQSKVTGSVDCWTNLIVMSTTMVGV